MSARWLKLLDFINAEILAFYAIDRANRQIIFAKFELADHENPSPPEVE
jgi:hypothetical protein